MGEYQRLSHSFAPVFDENSKVLILGSFPSVKSREHHFYYGHPQNRFWKILAGLMKEDVPETIGEKKYFLLKHRIAVWDVIQQCDIIGSSDSSIKNVVPADLTSILQQADVRRIYGNGGKACELYQKYIFPETKREIVKLPSSSPANAAYRMERLLNSWGDICEVLDGRL